MKADGALKRGLLLLVLAAMAGLPLLMKATPVQGSPPSPPAFASGRVLVKFEPGTGAAERAAVHRRQGGALLGVIPGIAVEVVAVPARTEEASAAGYARSPHTIFAEPDFIAYALEDPVAADPFFGKQWGLHNVGQEYDGRTGTEDADIDALEAWGVTTGSPDVRIAILDSGIDPSHPDLDGKLVDEAKDFTGSLSTDDNYGHGTHVAGIAAAESNNGIGVAGVAHDASLVNVKVLGDEGWGASSWIAEGIWWATENGAQVINMSLGFYRKSRTLEAAVDEAWNSGVLLVAAAGNDGTSRKLFPAAYANCMAVAATNDDDQRADEPGWWASNYGEWVDVAAPGLFVFSTFPTHDYFLGKALNYDYGSGTSMATPHVAGLAGLLFGQDPLRTNADVRSLIEDTADAIPGTGTYWVHGRINACNAVGGECFYGGQEPPPEGTMHVLAVEMEYKTSGRNYLVSTTVAMVDANNAPVGDATVDVVTTLPDGGTADSSGVTGADGTAILTLKSRQAGTYVAKVTNVTHASFTYVPGDNVETSESLPVP
jgi:thermitase